MNGMGPLIDASKGGNPALMGNGTHAYGGFGSVADANSPLPGILDSIDQFDSLGIPRDQIVVALPWCVCHHHAIVILVLRDPAARSASTN
jgi:hypothetical protein